MSHIGRTVEIKPDIFTDSRTGREVRRVTPADRKCLGLYVYQNAFTPDGRYLVYAGETGNGPQAFRCEIATGATTQLTDGEPLNLHCGSIHPDGREFFCRRADGATLAVDLETLEQRMVFDPAAHGVKDVGQLVMFSESGRWFSFSYSYEEGKAAIAGEAGDGSGFETVYRHNSGAQHVMFCPASDDLMSFSMSPDYQQTWDLPDIERSRTFLLDVRKGAIDSLLCFPKPFTATHDYWSPDGSRLYCHKKTRPTWVPTWIGSVDRITREHTIHFGSDTIMLGHSSVDRDETFIVSDSQNPAGNELIRIDLATGAHDVLCWPDSDVKGGHAEGGHVHPILSPKADLVLYTSNTTGLAQVYLVPLA